MVTHATPSAPGSTVADKSRPRPVAPRVFGPDRRCGRTETISAASRRRPFMSIHDNPPVNDELQVSPHQAAQSAATHGAVMTTSTGKWVATLRITTGLLFV